MFKARYIVNLFTLLWILQTVAESSGRRITGGVGPWGLSMPIRGGNGTPSASTPSDEPRPKKKKRKKKHHADHYPSSKKILAGSVSSEVKEAGVNDTEKMKKGKRKHKVVRKKRKHVMKQDEKQLEDLREIKSSSPAAEAAVPKKKKKVKKKRSSKQLKIDTHTDTLETRVTTNMGDIATSVEVKTSSPSLSIDAENTQNDSLQQSPIVQDDAATSNQQQEDTNDADHLGLSVDDDTGASDNEKLQHLVNTSVTNSEGVKESEIVSAKLPELDEALNKSISSLTQTTSSSIVEAGTNFNVAGETLKEDNVTKGEEIPEYFSEECKQTEETLNQENAVEENSSTSEAEPNLSGQVTGEVNDQTNTTLHDDGNVILDLESKEIQDSDDSSSSSEDSLSDSDEVTSDPVISEESSGSLRETTNTTSSNTTSKADEGPDLDAVSASFSSVVGATNTTSMTNATTSLNKTINVIHDNDYSESCDVDAEEKTANVTQEESVIKILSEATDTTIPPLPLNLQHLAEEADTEDDLHVSVVTWNLAEESPEEDDTKFIRSFRNHGVDKKGSDFVLISGQECENIKPRRTEGRRSREIRRLMIKQLGKRYVPIAIHQLGGIQFGLFCRRSIIGEVESVSVADVTCGIGNVFHNKGAIAAFVQLKARNKDNKEQPKAKSLKMLFVTAHMAAHVKNFEARNADYWRIMTELEAQAPPSFVNPSYKAEGPGGAALFDTADRVFFCGDLNYRMDLPREVAEHTVNQIKELSTKTDDNSRLLAKQMRSKLLIYDQLLSTMAAGNAFKGLVEAEIKFLPTFKYDKFSDDFDTSHKQRIPAYTDRVLFKPVGTRIVEYDSYVDAKHSDHRPVFATFRVNAEGRSLPTKIVRKKRSSKKKTITKRPERLD
jgi:hypothetical protein